MPTHEALRPTRWAIAFFALGLAGCDCSASHVPEADAALPDVQVDTPDASDSGPACWREPEPECATAPNSSVSLTLSAFDYPTIDLAFGYLSYNRGFDYSMSLRFMENGNADLCSPVELHGRILPRDVGLVGAGTHEVAWVFTITPAGFSHSFTSQVVLTRGNEDELFSGPVVGSIVDVGEVDSLVIRFNGEFDLDECEPWATSGS